MNLYEKVLREFAEETRDAAKRELGSQKIGKNRTYGVATRKLQRSLTFSMKDGNVSFGSPLEYGQFVHWGVNGRNRSVGSPYSYGSKMPPPDAILKWMKVKPVRLRNASGQFIKQTPSRLNSAAFLIARSIQKKGVKGVRYWTTAIETIYPRYRKKLSTAARKDVANQIVASVGNISIRPK